MFLLGALVIGAGAVVVLATVVGGGGSAAPQPEPPVARTVGEQQAVQAFAARFVTDWLGAGRNQEAALSRYVDLPDGLVLPERGVAAADPAVSDVERVAEGRWAVTISVLVDATRRYYRVPVRYVDGGLAAEALPAMVAAPEPASRPDLGYADEVGVTDPVGQTVSAFLSGLLAGSGDVNRYLTPGTQISPVRPAPFTSVELVSLTAVSSEAVDPLDGPSAPADGEQLELLATVVGDGDQPLTAQYALTLTARDGRWEITSLDSAPVVDELTQSNGSD